jgi:hypothetical protein
VNIHEAMKACAADENARGIRRKNFRRDFVVTVDGAGKFLFVDSDDILATDWEIVYWAGVV